MENWILDDFGYMHVSYLAFQKPWSDFLTSIFVKCIYETEVKACASTWNMKMILHVTQPFTQVRFPYYMYVLYICRYVILCGLLDTHLSFCWLDASNVRVTG